MLKTLWLVSTLACLNLVGGLVGAEPAQRLLVDLTDRVAIESRRPLLIAHRGGVVTDGVPECSLAAIRAASKAGYDLVELDIRESSDHEPIVFHDRNLTEACGVDGSVAELTGAELAEITYLKNGETISHLKDALSLCAQERMGVMLDIKGGQSTAFFNQIVDLLERFGLTSATLCINGARAVRENLGGRIMLTAGANTADAADGGPGSFWFGLASNLTAERTQELKSAGVLVIPAVNTFRYEASTHREDARADITRLLGAEVDGFQIDSIYQGYFGIEPAR